MQFGSTTDMENEEDITLPTFIRNKTHHPENVTMQSAEFSDKELKDSIGELIKLVRDP